VTSNIGERVGFEETSSLVGKSDSDEWAILAGLRFVLAVIVVMGHIAEKFAVHRDWTYVGLWLNQEGAVFGFLLLSGYSIAASLARDTSGYYRRRVIRIWPLYFATLLLGAGVCYITHRAYESPRGVVFSAPENAQVVAALFMLQSFASPVISWIAPTWSLSIEWWNYMIAPAIRRCPTWLLLVIVAESAYWFSQGFKILDRPYLSLGWLWILGFLFYSHRDSKYASALLTIPVMLVMRLGGVIYIPTIATLAVLMVCRTVQLPTPSIKLYANWLGDISYPLYLCHIPIIILLSYWGVRNSVWLVAGVMLGSVAMLYIVDYPCRKLGVRSSRFRRIRA
jgi:peptidoglycan/LPS O-acetylase OafA/YrhL